MSLFNIRYRYVRPVQRKQNMPGSLEPIFRTYPGRALLNPYRVYDRAQPNTLRITVVFLRNTWLSITIVILRSYTVVHDCKRSITEEVTCRFGSIRPISD